MSILIYLASPYSGTPEIEQQRFEEAARAFAFLTQQYKDMNTFFYSPIAACHPVKLLHQLPGDWIFWKAYDEAIIARCDQLWVLCINGWGESLGVSAERSYAKSIGRPIKFLYPKENGTYELS